MNAARCVAILMLMMAACSAQPARTDAVVSAHVIEYLLEHSLQAVASADVVMRTAGVKDVDHWLSVRGYATHGGRTHSHQWDGDGNPGVIVVAGDDYVRAYFIGTYYGDSAVAAIAGDGDAEHARGTEIFGAFVLVFPCADGWCPAVVLLDKESFLVGRVRADSVDAVLDGSLLGGEFIAYREI